MSIKIRLNNADFALKPGMVANIKIQLPENKMMLEVRSGSIIYDDNKSFVLKYENKCKVSIQRITIFKSDNDMNYVESDSLHDGNILILRNGLNIFTALKNL
jgi:cobalt-zinc-cadmium efflux system membrane fusion protein